MKKALIVILALLLLLTGLFFWRGGHHAIVLCGIVEDWLDEDSADQSLTLMFMKPGITVDDKGQVKPEVRQMTLNADSFWIEYHDRPLFGLTAHDMTAWIDGANLYMDTGKAYALPDVRSLRESARQLAWGLLLHGRVTKHNDTYNLSMKRGELELDVDITADSRLQTVSVAAILPDDSAVRLSITAKEAASHAVPQKVADAMVRAQMERPMVLTEPLEVLIPALEDSLPLAADMKLGVECGILKLAEDVVLTVNENQAKLTREGVEIDLPLPEGLSPVAMGLLLLRNGEFERTADGAVFTVTLPAETTSSLCGALVPQIGELGVTFGGSKAVLSIVGDALTAVSMTADGEVPFLITTIPVAFSAELNIR